MRVSWRGKDWSGKRVGSLTVTRCVGYDAKYLYVWECTCDCGKVVQKPSKQLTRGCVYCSHSCSLRGENQKTHGASYTKEYRAWVSMKARCYTSSHKNNAEYAGRGIKVCSSWVNDFEAFLSHVGPCPSPKHTIDRIDNDRDYEPGNVRWATQAEQNLNRRNTLKAEINGETLPLKTIAERYNVHYAAVLSRFKRGLTGEDLVTRQKIGRKPKANPTNWHQQRPAMRGA